jgi:SAM-dependent methyltransferase
MTSSLRCAFCDTPLHTTFVDLGMGPLVDSYVKPDELERMDPFLPLKAYVCDSCFLVQLPEAATPEELFGDYPYFSSVSSSWVEHARRYVEKVVPRFNLGPGSLAIEIASNDGYLLQFAKSAGLQILGIEPARNVAEVAREKGIPTVSKFFGMDTASEIRAEHGPADLLLGNNVMAHVPDRNDFVAGMKHLLAPQGTITMEFPHLLRTMAGNQFDQVFHEHFSYLSFVTIERIFARHGLALFDVEELPTHGGSIRIYAGHAEDGSKKPLPSVADMRECERTFGLEDIETYKKFTAKVRETKFKLLEFLIRAKRDNKRIAAYGAPGKGATLLNYCGIRGDFIDYIVDRSPHKQNLYMPGVRLPIFSPDKIRETKPDYVLILAWNLRDEIVAQMDYIREWGGQFVVPIPEVAVL